MKVLMSGWEFPPHILRGLGTASYGLTKGMSWQDSLEITFYIPRPWGNENQSLLRIISMNSTLVVWKSASWDYMKGHIGSYINPQLFYNLYDYIYTNFNHLNTDDLGCIEFSGRYPDNLHKEINNCSIVAEVAARQREFNIIHSHGWLTYPAGIHAKQVSGKSLVIHVYAAGFDRSHGNVNPIAYAIEKNGVDSADHIMCMDGLTHQIMIHKYFQDPKKVPIVHNTVSPLSQGIWDTVPQRNPSEKVVASLERITMRKEPKYFVEAAAMVLYRTRNVRLVMAGSDDMMDQMIRLVAERGITDRFHFPGFMRRKQVYEVLKTSDAYIMSSVSKPFGISPLEAMQCSVPSVISKQSDCTEILDRCIKTGYWNIHVMADTAHSTRTYPAMYEYPKEEGKKEMDEVKREDVGHKARSTYNGVVKNCGRQ